MIYLLLIFLFLSVTLFVLFWLLQGKIGKRKQTYYISNWNKILSKFESGSEYWYSAILEADNLLDEALIAAKFKGKTIGERLVAANRHFSDPNSVWKAHKIKSALNEKNKDKLKKTHAMAAIRGYKRALKDLGVIG